MYFSSETESNVNLKIRNAKVWILNLQIKTNFIILLNIIPYIIIQSSILKEHCNMSLNRNFNCK